MKEIPINELMLNPMTQTAHDWWLITAGDESGCNAMTASYGHLGTVWGHPTAIVYIREQRYTKQFVDANDYFTISVLDNSYRNALNYMGSHSGRDEDKFAAAGLTPAYIDGTAYVAEASLVYICKKLYRAPLIEEGFVDPETVERHYPLRDFHDVYVGEIIKVLAAEK